jgi:glycosyltransferase involved in cell wall biosynthesis
MSLEPEGRDATDSRIGVCLICDTVGADAGTERQVSETAKRLDKTKFDAHVCCLEPSPQLTALSDYCHTAVFPTDSANSWAGIRQAARLRQYLEQNRIQIVHAYMNKTAIFAVLASLISDRIVITSRLNTGYWYTPAWRRFFRVLNLGTARIMANSEQAKRIAVEAEHLSPKKVDVVYQGVDMNKFQKGAGDASICERMGIPPSWQVVGIVANLRPVKDIPLFLRAASIVARQLPEVAFLIIGRGEDQRELQNLADELGLQGRAFFTGGEGAVIDYLARMSVGCLTSKSEGFSNAILEYMAAGLPVVATDVGGNREAILDGETGHLVAERTPEAFAKPLLYLLTHEEERLAMGRKNLTRCQEHFELSRTIKNLEDYYCSLVAR